MDKLQQVVDIVYSPFSQHYIPKYQNYAKTINAQELHKISTFSSNSRDEIQTAIENCKYLGEGGIIDSEKPQLKDHMLKITPMPEKFTGLKATSAFQYSGYSVTNALHKNGSLYIVFTDLEDNSSIKQFAIKKVTASQKFFFEKRAATFMKMVPKELVENLKEYCLVENVEQDVAEQIWKEMN